MFVCLLYRPTRNPYDSNKIAGGSSSGSASLVSAGLCPVALGVDGGGIWFNYLEWLIWAYLLT